jgi:putative transcriptional regulator
MDKKIFKSILAGAGEAVKIHQGKRKPARTHKVLVPAEIDVKAVRNKLGMTQKDFAETFGFGLDTIKSWESGRREPERPARILLRIIERNPKAVLEATA